MLGAEGISGGAVKCVEGMSNVFLPGEFTYFE